MGKRLNSSNNLINTFTISKFKLHLCALLLSLCTTSIGQVSQQLTPEIQAYLFHIVRKSPILENNVGLAFEYSGPLVKLPDNSINYDSIDKILTVSPNLLIIRTDILARSPKGILIEACNKTAIYEICRQIQKYSDGEPISSLPLLDRYFTLFFDQLPNELKRGKLYEQLLNPLESPILLTNFSFNERLFNLQIKGFTKGSDNKLIIDAQGKAINQAIEERTRSLFQLLGGNSNLFKSMLLAAGDGSYTEGMLQERDKDENGSFNKGLPRAIGLFPYEVDVEKDKKTLRTKRITSKELWTIGNQKQTQVHFDVWGYNSTNQTTVIVEKGGRQYPLFGSQTTRFLTPDSTFSKGSTFMKVLNDLNDVTYKELKEALIGKNGLNEQIIKAQEQLGEIETIINQKEGDLGELYKEDYRTKNRAKRKELKQRKYDDPSLALKPKTKARKKAKNKHQSDLVELYAGYDETLSLVESLITERDELAKEFNHRDKIYKRYVQLLGEHWMPFTEVNGLYTFEDGTTFDIFTQDLTFPPTDSSELVEVRLLSIPEDYEGESSDEIMMHLSMVDVRPFFDADFEINFEDVFESDAYKFEGRIFTDKDTSFFKKLFESYSKNPLPIELTLDGMGIGMWKDSAIVRDPEQQEQTSYPGNTKEEKQLSRGEWAFKSLRHAGLQIKINRSLNIHIESSTDPVVSNLTSTALPIESLLTNNGISKNELLSVLRTRSILIQTKNELIASCPKYLSTQKAKKFIDQLEESVAQSKYFIGNKAIKIPKIKE
ncbi:MAG: hypothetical protein RL365_1370 [Bacteroidota bacterium]|jgi:hypothetical protein